MAKFRKKPVVIEAEQWLGPQSSPMRGVFVNGDTTDPANYFVVTIHGHNTPIAPGDWIIPEPDGEHFYPCKPDIFAATYEPVREPENGCSHTPTCRDLRDCAGV